MQLLDVTSTMKQFHGIGKIEIFCVGVQAVCIADKLQLIIF